MLKRLAWLWMAMLVVTGASAYAAEKATSMDRHLAPDQYPTHVVKILRSSNKAQTNSYVPVVFTMRNVNPFDVIRFLKRPIEPEDGLLYTFVSPEGNGGKVLYAVPEYQIEGLTELVKTLDRPGLTTSAGDKRVFRQLKHRRADMSDLDFLNTAGSFTTGNGSIISALPGFNALWWQDAPSGTETLDKALTDWLDVPTAMVNVAVKLYELNTENDSQLGLDYMAWKNGPGADLFVVGAYSEYGSYGRAENALIDPLGTGAVPHDNFAASGWNYAYKYDVPSQFFDWLAVKGKARILNQAKLAVLNTRSASITSADQILYYPVKTTDPSGIRDTGNIFQANSSGGTATRVVTGATTSQGPVTNAPYSGAPEAIDVGLKVWFGSSPHQTDKNVLISEETLVLPIEIELGDYNGIDQTGFPQINQRALWSELRLGLSDEIIIGGLKRQTTIKSSKGIPVLKSLPVIGYMFGGEGSNNKTTEVVVAVAPQAVVNYDLVKDYTIDDQTKHTIDMATGVEPVAEPKMTWGFDQMAVDPEYKVQAPSFE